MGVGVEEEKREKASICVYIWPVYIYVLYILYVMGICSRMKACYTRGIVFFFFFCLNRVKGDDDGRVGQGTLITRKIRKNRVK